MKTGIIGAVQQEVDLLFAELTQSGTPVKVIRQGALEFHDGMLDGCPVTVVCCGVGKVNAALCAQILISVCGTQAVINTGAAGSLDPDLTVLDMVVSTDAVQHDMDATKFGYSMGQVPGCDSPFFPADPVLRKIAMNAFERVMNTRKEAPVKIKEGRIASGDLFVADEDARNRIRTFFSPLCVEMEGAAIAQVCAVNRVPFVILRSISDNAGEEAGMSYEDFSAKAARVSSEIVREMLADCQAL